MTRLLAPAPKTLVEDLARRLSGPGGLAPLSARRLALLIELMDEAGYIGYAAAYARLFPAGSQDPAEKTKADKAFHKFRHTLREAAAVQKIQLELQPDANRNADPERRRFWFVAADNAEDRLTEFNLGATGGLVEHPQEQTLRIRGEQPSYLLLYAEQEQADARALHRQLRTRIQAYGEDWTDLDFHRIPVGEDKGSTRARYLEQADLILILVSVALIAEIKKKDIPPLPRERLIPLAFKGFDDDQLTGTSLADLQIFRDTGGKAWNQRKNRETWAAAAAQTIFARMDRPRDPAATMQKRLAAITGFSDDHLADCPVSHFVDPHLRKQGDTEGREALPFLLDWLRRPHDGLPYCAIFGELGMGKTTLSQRLTRKLLELRQTEPEYPLPVYLDLRAVNTMSWDWRTQGVPPLEDMIAHLLEAAYNLPVDQARPSVEDIKRLAQEQGGLVIFDGLDEVMNQLPPDQCRHFIQRLWEILPPRVWFSTDSPGPSDPDRSAADRQVGRLIMTCRSHFFQTLRDQLNTLGGQQREAVGAKDYLWVTLLPFGREQVETYFRQVLAAEPQRAGLILEMLDRVHDLRGLSNRPYNLRLIQDQVENLEAIHRGGGRISVADLYENMVDQWTDRDSPKHRLNRDHKLLLMEQLAHRLWSCKQKSLDYRALEDWLLDQLVADPKRRLAYRAYLDREKGTDILQEDLRNATFLVREGEDRFRFAHTSIMEFFLARALLRALVAQASSPARLLEAGEQAGDPAPDVDLERNLAAWKIPVPSPETLDFLGDLLRKTDATRWQPAFRTIRKRYREGVSELALAYGLHAHRQGLPAPSLAGMDLAGADLKDWRFEGPADGPPLNLSRVRLTGSRLMNARFRRVDLSGADLTGTELTRAELWAGSARNACLRDADLTGTRFRGLDLTGADLRAGRCYRTQLLACTLDRTLGPDTEGILIANCRLDRHLPPPQPQAPAVGTLARVLEGHQGSVLACAWSPDASRLVSAGADGTLRLWDAAGGECLAVLEGHQGRVLACGWSPDGGRLVSAGDDGDLRLWDAASGEPLAVLEGHQGRVLACGWSPDGGRLVSAGDDGTLRLWDAASGEHLAVFRGHGDLVLACAWSPDGSRLVSAGDDGTLRLWDAATEEPLAVLQRHRGRVWACGWSPDGGRLVSAGDDGKLRLWDAAGGEPLAVLQGHEGPVLACGWSPDGGRLVSVGNNGTLRLWDAASGECLAILEDHQGSVRACAWSPDGSRLVSAGDHNLRLWDAESGECLAILEGHQGGIFRGVNACDWSPDGSRLVSAGTRGTLRLWDAGSGESLAVLEGHEDSIWACGWSPEGGQLVSAGSDGTLRLWDAGSGEPLAVLEGHRDWVLACGWSPDGSRLVSADANRTLRLWDAGSGEPLAVLEGHRDWVLACGWSPDGSRLVSAGSDGSLRLWDAANGECLAVLQGHQGRVLACGWSPDGGQLVSAGDDGNLRLWDAAGGEPLAVLTDRQGWVWACAWSPEGGRLVSAGDNGTLRLWDAATGESLAVLAGHQGSVLACGWSPDGDRLVSAGDDGTLRLWDAATGEPITIIHMFEDREYAVLEPDGSGFRSASPGAWRWLGWQTKDPTTGRLERLPAETFGPIPGMT